MHGSAWGQVLRDSSAAESNAQGAGSSFEGWGGWGAALHDTLNGSVDSQSPSRDPGIVDVSASAVAADAGREIQPTAPDPAQSLAVPTKRRAGRPPGSTGSRMLRQDMQAFWSRQEESLPFPSHSEELQLESWMTDQVAIADSRMRSQKRAKADAIIQSARPFGQDHTFLSIGTSTQKLMSNCVCSILANSQSQRHSVF